MIGILLVAVSFAAIANVANAECANACNGHGTCNAYDMCLCNRNWQASDCSERVCMFGLAHVDTPKGDLDMNGVIQPPNNVIIDNSYAYPYGTTEQFPQMQDSDLQDLTNSAHYYMECSNKGKCDRSTGECQCYDGYDGVACQRASCPGFPNSCSGHGICKTIEQLAAADNGNVYKLWDLHTTMGCECDKGYSGADCSLRECKYGVDPLYLDDVATVKASVYDFATLSTKNNYASNVAETDMFTNGEEQSSNGNWAIRFFDAHGEDWVTEPIAGGADCDAVMDALYGIPNDVIPADSLRCVRTVTINGKEGTFSQTEFSENTLVDDDTLRHPYRLLYRLALSEARTPNNQGELSDYTDTTVYVGSADNSTAIVSGMIYRIRFMGNPGKIRSPEIELHLDGKRPSLVVPDYKVITKVWSDGQQGESIDHFADHCDGVTATISHDTDGSSFLNGMTATEKNLFKKCLGDADFDTSNNQDVYNWDKGSKLYPHMIKLVRTVTTQFDGGYYAVVWYDTDSQIDQTHDEGTFRLLNPFYPPDAMLTDNYDIYTTKGTLALTSNMSEATFGFASKYIYMTNVTYDVMGYNSSSAFDGDISCEIGNNNAGKMAHIQHCLNKTDLFTVINWEKPAYNPPYINMYTAERLYTGNYKHSVSDRFAVLDSTAYKQGIDKELHYMTHFINTDVATNWAASVGNFTFNTAAFPADSFNDFGKPQFHVYKFFPSDDSSYEYVAECSNRGLCDTDAGVCDCFPGYTNDNCDTQSSLAV